MIFEDRTIIILSESSPALVIFEGRTIILQPESNPATLLVQKLRVIYKRGIQLHRKKTLQGSSPNINVEITFTAARIIAEHKRGNRIQHRNFPIMKLISDHRRVYLQLCTAQSSKCGPNQSSLRQSVSTRTASSVHHDKSLPVQATY